MNVVSWIAPMVAGRGSVGQCAGVVAPGGHREERNHDRTITHLTQMTVADAAAVSPS